MICKVSKSEHFDDCSILRLGGLFIDQLPHYLHMGGVITKLGFRPLHSTPLHTTSPPHTTHSNPPQTFMRLHDFFLLELLKNRFGDVITHYLVPFGGWLPFGERELITAIFCLLMSCDWSMTCKARNTGQFH